MSNKVKVVVFDIEENKASKKKIQDVTGYSDIEVYTCNSETNIPSILNGVLYDSEGYSHVMYIDHRYGTISDSGLEIHTQRSNRCMLSGSIDYTLSIVEKKYLKGREVYIDVLCNTRAYTQGYSDGFGKFNTANTVDVGYYSLNCSILDIEKIKEYELLKNKESVKKVFREDIGGAWEYEFILRSIKAGRHHVNSVIGITETLDIAQHLTNEDFEIVKKTYHTNKLEVDKTKNSMSKLK